MVTPDWDAPARSEITIDPERPDFRFRLARPLDRLAATIIDVGVVLTPIFFLLGAPLKRGLTLGILVNSESDMLTAISGLGVLAFVLSVVYQAVSLYLFGMTFGKRVLAVRVVPVFRDQSLTFTDCLVRATTWTLELALLGLPWLAVFANPRRRVLHDRVSDTVVVALANEVATAPTPTERSLVRATFAIVTALGLAVGVNALRGATESLRAESALLAMSDKNLHECEVVGENVGAGDHARLNRAMTLYAAGLADRSCLESEVEREAAMDVPVAPVTYLAQAFVHADDAEVSNSYLDQVCSDAPDGPECAMSQLVGSWSEENWPAVEQTLKTAPRGSGYLEVWGVRHYMKQARYGEALALLDDLIARHELADFSLGQRVKALFNSFRESEAQAALTQALVALPEGDGHDLGAWMCAQQLQNGCAALEAPACRALSSKDISFADPNETLAQVIRMECRGSMDYLALSESAADTSWQDFFRANLKREREDRAAAASLFTKLIRDENTPEPLRIEAARRFLQFANVHQVDAMVETWRGFESRESWVKLGNILFARLAETKNSDLALKVARHLMNGEALSPRGLGALQAMIDVGGSAERRPASAKVREQVKQLVDALGDSK